MVAVLAFVVTASWLHGGTPQGEDLEYEVISIEPQGWVVTARETASGNVVKFRLPPTVFKGKTFEFDAEENVLKPGGRFSVRGARNERLNQLVVENPLPGESPRGKGRFTKRVGAGGPPPNPLGWEILHVDPRKWIVTAKNNRTHKTVKFQVHPEAFTGFRFHANLRGIQKGRGFSIVTPNELPMKNCCTILELKQ